MFKHVLVPIDGSEPSHSAIDLALRITKDSGGNPYGRRSIPYLQGRFEDWRGRGLRIDHHHVERRLRAAFEHHRPRASTIGHPIAEGTAERLLRQIRDGMER